MRTARFVAFAATAALLLVQIAGGFGVLGQAKTSHCSRASKSSCCAGAVCPMELHRHKAAGCAMRSCAAEHGAVVTMTVRAAIVPQVEADDPLAPCSIAPLDKPAAPRDGFQHPFDEPPRSSWLVS